MENVGTFGSRRLWPSVCAGGRQEEGDRQLPGPSKGRWQVQQEGFQTCVLCAWEGGLSHPVLPGSACCTEPSRLPPHFPCVLPDAVRPRGRGTAESSADGSIRAEFWPLRHRPRSHQQHLLEHSIPLHHISIRKVGGGVRRIATQLAFSTCCGLVLQSMLIEKKRKKSVTEERRGQG